MAVPATASCGTTAAERRCTWVGMKSTYVDPATGDVVCPVCGARNQFTVKRTAKAKWTGIATVGVGMAAMPKRLSCNGCGTNLKRGGGSAPPAKRSSVTPRPIASKPATPAPVQPVPAQVKKPPAPTGDIAWDTLVENAKRLGLIETGGNDLRWLKGSDGRTTVARYSVSQSKLDINLTNQAARESALALDGVTEIEGVRGYIEVPHEHHREWERLVALAVGRDDLGEPETSPEAGDSGFADSPAVLTSELERLADLHARGSLTDEEFQQAKARVLGAE